MKHLNSGNDLLLVLEALSNSHRLKIIGVLYEGRQYVSQLARELGISRPLLYLHLQKLEEAKLITSEVEILENGKAAKFYMLIPFEININSELICSLIPSLTIKKKN